MKYKVLKKIALVNETNFMANGEQITPDLLALFRHEKFEFTHDIAEADIVPLQINLQDSLTLSDRSVQWMFDNFGNTKIGVVINGIGHISEVSSQHTKLLCDIPYPFEKTYILHTDTNYKNSDVNSDVQCVYVDHLWNRQYAMFYDNDMFADEWKNMSLNHWYSAKDHHYFDSTMWELTPDEEIIPNLDWYDARQNLQEELSAMIYVCPGITRHLKSHDVQERGKLRLELHKLLEDYPGFQGNITLGNNLLPQRSKYTNEDMLGMSGWGFSPIHNAYYDSSVISFYVETITYTSRVFDTACVTEKTWNPILKGHFVLPFGRAGLIDLLKRVYGLKFPDWIDYSYDNIDHSDVLRWQTYLTEVKRICNLGADFLYQKKRQDLDILLHNRNLMKNSGYRNNLEIYF